MNFLFARSVLLVNGLDSNTMVISYKHSSVLGKEVIFNIYVQEAKLGKDQLLNVVD